MQKKIKFNRNVKNTHNTTMRKDSLMLCIVSQIKVYVQQSLSHRMLCCKNISN